MVMLKGLIENRLKIEFTFYELAGNLITFGDNGMLEGLYVVFMRSTCS